MVKRILAVIVLMALLISMTIRPRADAPYRLETHKTSFYCPESAGEITATGKHVRYGICAVDKAHIGMTVGLYSDDMTEFYGWFECEDTGGKAVQNGLIDVWFPDMESGREWMKKTGGTVKAQYINAKG